MRCSRSSPTGSSPTGTRSRSRPPTVRGAVGSASMKCPSSSWTARSATRRCRSASGSRRSGLSGGWRSPIGSDASEAPRLVRRLAFLAVGLVAATYFASFVSYGIYLEDEGLLLHQIARTARGETPFIDFHTGYSPGTFYLNAALFRLFGESVIPLRGVLVVVNAAAIALLFGLARPLAGGLLAAVAALGYMAFLPSFVGEFASFNIPRIRPAVILGPPLTLIVGRLVRARARLPHPYRLHTAVGLVAAGAAAPVLPWVIYFLVRLGPRAFVHDVLLVGAHYEIIYGVQYPMPTGWTSMWPVLGALGLAGLGVVGLAAERGAVRVRRVLGWLGLAVLLLGALAARRARMPEG